MPYFLRLHWGLIAMVGIGLSNCVTTKTQTVFPTAPGTTSNAENLTRETSDPEAETYPSVSPDGKFLLYNSLLTTTTWNYDPNRGLNRNIDKRMNIVKKEIGKPVRNPLVQNASDPTWTPSGDVIFSYVKPVKPVIVRSNNNGIGLNYISQGEMGDADASPSMTHDGKKVIFTTLIGGARMICSMDANGGSYTVITEGDHPRTNPNDDSKLIYNNRVGNRTQIFTLDLRTGQKTQLTTGEYNNFDGAFSRDGRYIAFCSNRENPTRNNNHLYAMRADGTGLIQLTQGETNEGDPCWGPDGQIYFHSNAERNINIWKVRPRLQ